MRLFTRIIVGIAKQYGHDIQTAWTHPPYLLRRWPNQYGAHTNNKTCFPDSVALQWIHSMQLNNYSLQELLMINYIDSCVALFLDGSKEGVLSLYVWKYLFWYKFNILNWHHIMYIYLSKMYAYVDEMNVNLIWHLF